ncbi:transmembrane amino acid transporter protein-domain-containing protein [Phycomyces nitens]|nr:transmembrane amino acid transporter protein-domain-containing protein [Phycomyces nitens]
MDPPTRRSSQHDSLTPEQIDLLQSTVPGYGTRSILEVSLNIVNATVGAGVIGLPFAIMLSGFSFGLSLAVFVAVLTYLSLYSLVPSGKRIGVYTFASLAEHSMGRFGYHMLNLMLFAQSAGSCVSYFILIADTIPILLGLYLPQFPILADRQIVTVVASIVLVYPLNLFRSIGALAAWSAFSVLLLPVMILTVLIRAPAYAPQHDSPLFTIGQDPFGAMGIITFAFVCTQVGFSNFLSQKNQSASAWKTTSFLATGMSFIICILFASIGYLSFGMDVNPNIFANFPADDNIINIGRLALGVSMILTVPMAFYPARDAVQKTLGFESATRQPTFLQHHIVTFVMFAIFLGLGINVHSLGKVYALVGGIASSFLAYIIPGTSYIIIFRPEWLKPFYKKESVDDHIDELSPLIESETIKESAAPTWWLDISSVVLVLFGSVVMTVTAVGAFR